MPGKGKAFADPPVPPAGTSAAAQTLASNTQLEDLASLATRLGLAKQAPMQQVHPLSQPTSLTLQLPSPHSTAIYAF